MRPHPGAGGRWALSIAAATAAAASLFDGVAASKTPGATRVSSSSESRPGPANGCAAVGENYIAPGQFPGLCMMSVPRRA
jgi:hypothetical protein